MNKTFKDLIERIGHFLSFWRRAKLEYWKEIESREATWAKEPEEGAEPPGSTDYAFSVEHFPVSGEFRPVVHITTVLHHREYRTVRTGRKSTTTVPYWKRREVCTKNYLHLAPKWLGPSSARNFGLGFNVNCGLADGMTWMAPSVGESRQEAPPCSTREEALNIIALYREVVLGHGIKKEEIN